MKKPRIPHQDNVRKVPPPRRSAVSLKPAGKDRFQTVGSLREFDLLKFAGEEDPWKKNYLAGGFGDVSWLRSEIAFWRMSGLGRIADIGSGFGKWSVFLAEVNDQVVGFELNREAVELSRRLAGAFELDNLTYEVANMAALPVDAATFDGVWCANVLHVTDRAKALREANRVMRIGGRLVVVGFNAAGAVVQKFVSGCRRGGLGDNLAQWALRCLERGPRHDGAGNFADVDVLPEMLALCGFKLEDSRIISLRRLNLDETPVMNSRKTVATASVDVQTLALRLKTDEGFRSAFLVDQGDARLLPGNVSFTAIKARDLTDYNTPPNLDST